MRTIYPVVVTLAIVVAALMFTMSGAADIFGTGSSPGDSGVVGQAESVANDSAANDGVDTSAKSNSDLIGFIIGGLSTIASVVKLVVALPLTLEQIGFPKWFSYPLGIVMEIILSIGIAQFISGRVWQ